MPAAHRWSCSTAASTWPIPAPANAAYAAGHLPGALYVHLDRDLSGAKTGGNGRHPLPERQALAERAGAWGIAPGVQVVCYDAQGMPYAARAWWLLRWLGHEAVAVLDGGTDGLGGGGRHAHARGCACHNRSRPIRRCRRRCRRVDAAELLAQLGRRPVLDARAAERFRGETEPLDPVAGHIPGALNRFFKNNLQADGRFKPADALRAEFEALHTAPARAGAPVRLGRDRLPQPAGHGTCRAGRFGAVPRFVERMVRRPEPPGGARLRAAIDANQAPMASDNEPWGPVTVP